MAVRSSLSLKGFDEYLERVAAAGKDVDAAVAEAVAAGGDVLLAGMERRVAEDTGNLKSKLERTAPVRDGNYTFVTVGLPRDVDAETARYGNAQEFGSSSMAAHPYVRPTMAEDSGKARAKVRQTLKDEGVV